MGYTLNIKGAENIPKDNNFIISFNHISIIEPIVLAAVFGNISCVISDRIFKHFPGSSIIINKFHAIMIDNKPNSNNTKKICDHLKKNVNPIAIAPDGMQYPEFGNNIGNFKTGAFVPMAPILPVIIKYKNYDVLPDFKYDAGEDSIHGIMKLFLNSNTTIDIDIMNLVHPEKDWTPVLYKEHVFKLMNNRYGET